VCVWGGNDFRYGATGERVEEKDAVKINKTGWETGLA